MSRVVRQALLTPCVLPHTGPQRLKQAGKCALGSRPACFTIRQTEHTWLQGPGLSPRYAVPTSNIAPLLKAQCDHVIDTAADFARRISQGTLSALRNSSAELNTAMDRRLIFTVAEALQIHHNALDQAVAHCLKNQILEALSQLSRDMRLPTSTSRISISELSLVSDDEAEATVETSRIVQLVKLDAEWELAEWQSCCAAVLGEKDLRAESNPLRPEVYAQALSDAARVLNLDTPPRQLLLRVAGQVLAKQLKDTYSQLIHRVQQQGVQPLAYRAMVQASAPNQQVDVTQPGQLDALLHRLPAKAPSQRPDPALTALLASSQASEVDLQALSGLSHLLEQMVAQTASQPTVQPMVRQLQPALFKLAVNDSGLLSRGDHPGWQLINDMLAYVAGFSRQDDVSLKQFLSGVQPLINRLIALPNPVGVDYDLARQEVRALIEKQDAQLLQDREAELETLREADHKETLRPLLREQVEHQLRDRTVPLAVGDFLRGPWVEVMILAMTSKELGEDESQCLVNVVDELIDSLQHPTSLEAKQQLRDLLPDLTATLRKGMALIDMPPHARATLMEQLMAVHGRFLRSPPRPRPELTPEEIVQQMREEHVESQWLHSRSDVLDTGVDDLPTIPMGLEDHDSSAAEASAAAWVDHLLIGTWCKLTTRGHWSTARVVWISEHRHFFVVTLERTDQLVTLTRKALIRLRNEGLATELQDRSAVQTAADQLIESLPR